MIIKSIQLTNFRNHSHFLLECNDEVTLILGKNGFGKTSILEAIYILTRGKSFRATDSEIKKRDTDFYRIELNYQNGEKTIATYDGNKKSFLLTDKKTSRLPRQNKYPVILFLPSDLNLISHAPGRRRDYFNQVFSQLDENYASTLSKYDKALKQRNELLKKEGLKPEDLFSWNVLLSRYGTKLLTMRKAFIKEINQNLNDIYYSIAEVNDHILLTYKTDAIQTTEANYLKTIEQNFPRDSILGHTTFGVHRDDFVFEFNHKIADGSASRGETRSIILALKFLEASMIKKILGQPPIILLDDVFSELDDTRRKCLINNFQHNQVIITSVESLWYNITHDKNRENSTRWSSIRHYGGW